MGSGQFNAALFDQSGYYLQNDTGDWEAATGPGHFYATRISSNSDWILSVIPEPSTPFLFVVGLLLAAVAPRFISRRNR